MRVSPGPVLARSSYTERSMVSRATLRHVLAAVVVVTVIFPARSWLLQSQLVAVIRWIESGDLLLLKVELRSETIRELGFKRRGPKIVAAVESAIDVARGR